jgi:hypothetical protein
MDKSISPSLLLHLLFAPKSVFKVLADQRPSPMSVFFRIALWFGILPPVFAYLGARKYGWNLGVIEPLYL